MIDNIKEIALITPLKDEIDNIERFFKSVSAQTIKIKCLVIVENDSVDGSKEYLSNVISIKNVDKLKIINLSFKDKSYDLGFKYSELIHSGLKYLQSLDCYNQFDYIGILDSDCFPNKNYYETLINHMEQVPRLGITSGIIYTEEGDRHLTDINWVRGGCRIWKRKCIDQTGFPIEPSPDAITVALAHIYGWETETVKSAKVISREVNVRMSNYKNQGKRSYYRGNTLLYAFFKLFYLSLVKFKPKVGIDFFKGYLEDYRQNKPRIGDERIIKYYSGYMLRKLKNKTSQ